ncbi:sulfonate ABC transporter substrate-binding protein [Brevibacillus sp. B_LB10_24]|uniref:sulfonate ABC transporter substrate-binding protein n=1 Tax=Brevibacillus sp. B_LB10_24 TaxID=3380645 RepID=UPI0038BAE756
MNKYTVFGRWTAICLALMLVLAGCGSAGKQAGGSADTKTSGSTDQQTGSADKSGKVIRIGYQKGNTLNILKESGLLEKSLKEQGYQVEWKVFASGGPLLEALFSGSIDYGHAADGPGIFAQASNKPLVYVGADLPNPEGVGVMVLKDSGLGSIADLKGKKIAALKGGNHHYLAVLALEKAGLTADDVEWVYVKDASQGRAVFETKQVDALASWDPFFAGVETDLQTVNLTEGIDYQYPNRTFYFANVKFAEEHPELVKAILEATQKSDEWANENKPEVIKLLSEMLGIDQKVMTRAIERRQYGVEKITPEVIQAQQVQADVFYRIGLIPKQVNVAEIMPVDAKWAPELNK